MEDTQRGLPAPCAKALSRGGRKRSMYVTERSRPAREANMSPMKPSPQMTTLSRALADCGGEAPLAKKLGVSVDVLSGWLRGHQVLPADMYLRARELAALGACRPA